MAEIKRCYTAVVVPLLVVLSLILGGLFPPLHDARSDPGVLYAAPAAQGSGDCSSWPDACTLQSALDQAVSSDEIWVQEGVHTPGSIITNTFSLKNGVALYGGFAGWESELGQRDWTANITVLSGDIGQDDITDPNGVVTDTVNIQGENAYHVVMGSGVTETAVLDGFTITAGQANSDWPDDAGGGMHNELSNPMLANVTFSGNSAKFGGGMYNHGSPTLTNVTFSSNSAGGGSGGGMYNYGSPTLVNVAFSSNSTDHDGGGMSNWFPGSNPTLTNVTFSGNSAAISGGGMSNKYECNPTLTDVTFSGNSADYGGGMLNSESSATLTNVTFSSNFASSSGGGMHEALGNSTLTNVAFNGNSADSGGGGMYNRYNSSPTLTNVTFSGNSADYGGGMLNSVSSATLTNVTFSSNSASSYGGGMHEALGNSTLTNVAFNGNSADSGGGMHNWESNPTLTNVTFSGNSANFDGGGMSNWNGSSPTLANVILWGNTAPEGAGIYNYTSAPQISYSDIQGCGGSGSWDSACGADGGGNIDADPLFVDAPNVDLRLRLASPAIDAGDNAALPPDIFTDLDGNPRFVDIATVPDTGSGAAPIVDMGAYEAQFIDVTLSKAMLPPEAAPGEAITFSLTLTNTGSLPATGIIVTDTLPALLWGVSFTSTLTVTDTGYLPAYVWLAQDLAPGQVGVITASGVLTLPLAAGIYTNTAFIAAAGDLLAENNTAIITFSVPNLAPVFTSAPLLTAMEAAPYTYATTAQDDNGDGLAITASTLPAWLALEDHGDGTATLSGTPATSDVGEHTVVLQVTDSGGLTNTQSFTITIAYLNDSPFFTSTPVLTATQDAPYAYVVATDDPDLIHGDELTITAPTLPSWLTLEDHGDGTATLSGTPDNADVGAHLVVLRVSDLAGLFAEQSFTVTVANVNDAPVFTSAPVLTATQDAPYAYVVTADDPDLIHGDALTITAPTLPGWLTLEDHGDGTAILSGMPVTLGDYPVILRVTDHLEAFAEQSFTITVAETPGYYTFLPLMLRSAP